MERYHRLGRELQGLVLLGPVVVELQREAVVILDESSDTAVYEVNGIRQCLYPDRNVELVTAFTDLFVDKASLPLIPVGNVDNFA